MFMISAIIILLGGISLTRLPVDLLPDVQLSDGQRPRQYPGVGPQEIEQLLTRPIEQAVGAVAGLEQINSTSQEGSSIVRLSFAWGTDLSEAMDDLRTRLDRVRGRLPEDAEALTIFRQDSNAMPIMSLGIEGNYDRVTLREIAENQLSPRLERVNGVAVGHDHSAVCGGRSTSSCRKKRSRRSICRSTASRPAPHREPEHAARRGEPGRPHLPAPEPVAIPEPR